MHSGLGRSEREKCRLLLLIFAMESLSRFAFFQEGDRFRTKPLAKSRDEHQRQTSMSEKRKRNTASELHQSEGTTTTMTTSPTSTIRTKDCDLQSSLEGATGAKNRVYRLGLYIYRQRST